MKELFSGIATVLILLGYFSVPTESATNKLNRKIEVTDFKPIKVKQLITDSLLATKYNAVESQCDDTPFITADNSNICPIKLNKYKLKWVAVSRDMLKRYPYGTKILVQSSNEKLNGVWEVHDTMNKRHKGRIDFLVPLNDNYGFDRPMNVKVTKID